MSRDIPEMECAEGKGAGPALRGIQGVSFAAIEGAESDNLTVEPSAMAAIVDGTGLTMAPACGAAMHRRVQGCAKQCVSTALAVEGDTARPSPSEGTAMSRASKPPDRMTLPTAGAASGEVSGHRLLCDDRASGCCKADQRICWGTGTALPSVE